MPTSLPWFRHDPRLDDHPLWGPSGAPRRQLLVRQVALAPYQEVWSGA